MFLHANANSDEAPSVHEPLLPDYLRAEYVLNPVDHDERALCILRVRNMRTLRSTEQLAAYALNFAPRDNALHGFVNNSVEVQVLQCRCPALWEGHSTRSKVVAANRHNLCMAVRVRLHAPFEADIAARACR